jgi:hypothetical protein
MAMVVPAATRQDPPITIGVSGHSSQTPWAAALGNVVAVAFGAQASTGSADVYVTISRDSGRHFATPVRVNAVAGDARLGGELPPRVGLVPRGADVPGIVVSYGARAQSTEIRLSRSLDGGRTFSAPRALQAPGAPGDRGWHAMAIDGAGAAHVMWLDHRGLAAGHDSSGHHAGEAAHHAAAKAEQEAIDGVAMAERSGLYYARDGAAALGERELMKGVCYCCKVALVSTPRNGLLAAWRHVYAGNIRDIAFVGSDDGGQHFGPVSRVSQDDWQLAGCPDDGPALAVDGRGAAHIAWPTVIAGAAPEGAIFYASSTDLQTFGPRMRVPTLGGPRPMHLQVLADGDRVYIAWDEAIGGVRQAAVRSVRLIDEGGQLSFGAARQLGEPGVPSSYPFLVSTSTGPLAIYVSGKPGDSVIRVTRF